MWPEVWLRYLPPSCLIQQRRGVIKAYEIWHVELNLEVGRVELYADDKSGGSKWRTLDHWKEDYKDGHATREEAAQNLVKNCPRVVARLEQRRVALGKPPG